MAAVEQGAALALIDSKQVTADQHGSIFLPDTIPVSELGELRLLVVVAIARSLAYRTAPADVPGVVPVPTTLGEVVLRRGNPDAYASRHEFGIRDGKVTASEVAR